MTLIMLEISAEDLPQSFENKIIKNDEHITVIRSNLFTVTDINQWMKDFGINTNTHWNLLRSCPNGERFICWKKYICHHSSHVKVKMSVRKTKNFNCEASVLIKIKLNNHRTRYSDPFVKLGLCAVITVKNKHSHPLDSKEVLSFLPASENVKIRFFEYFQDGMGIAESCRHHQTILHEEGCSEIELASGRINPSERIVRYWYDQWRQLNLGGVDTIKKRKRRRIVPIAQDIDYEFTNDSFSEADEAVSMENGLNLKSPNIVYINSTSDCDALNESVGNNEDNFEDLSSEVASNSNDTFQEASSDDEDIEKILKLIRNHDLNYGSSLSGLTRFREMLEKVTSHEEWEAFLHMTAASTVTFQENIKFVYNQQSSSARKSIHATQGSQC